MPAPAPWAKTKQARGCAGSSNKPDTLIDPLTAMLTGLGSDDGMVPQASKHCSAASRSATLTIASDVDEHIASARAKSLHRI
jgi:hypothetical protein